MPGSDLRVPMGPILEAFGVPATVTRPAPNDEPIAVTAVWMALSLEERDQYPIDLEITRRDPRKVLAFQRDSILTGFDRGALIQAPEVLGGPVKTWIADGYDRAAKNDEWRVIVREQPEVP